MRRFFTQSLTLLLAVFLLNTFLFQTTGAVDGRDYTLVYPSDKESQEKIKGEITSSGIGEGNGGLEATYILVKDGILGTMQFNFDREKSNSQDALIYTSNIYCTLPKDSSRSACSTSAPSGNIYATFTLALGIEPGNGTDFLDKDNFRAKVGAWDGEEKNIRIPNVSEPFSLDAKDKIDWKIHAKLQTDHTWKEGDFRGNDPYKLSKAQADTLMVEKIMNNIVDRSAYISVFQKLTDAQKNAWNQAAEAAGLSKPSEAAAVGAGDEGEAGVNCHGGPMGWLFCPVINYMTDALQISAKLIDGLMQVKFLAQQGDSKQIEQAWRAFLSIANIMLVIAFMVIVFSQATGSGLNNYNIKRMLPRLVIAAILMNVSFYIVAFMIDVSNIVGASIMGLFIGDQSIGTAIEGATGGEGGHGILGGALTGALLIGLLFLILTPVVLSIIVVLVALIARQLILMCLVMVAPLAFAAWLLPNTEKYFKKWYDLLLQMLILYPVVMMVFGMSLFFAMFLGAGGQNIVGSDDSNINEMLTQIIQLVVLCIPLIAVPFLIKSSSSIMGTISGYANKFGAATAGKATDKISAGAKARGAAWGKLGAYGAAEGAKWGGRAIGRSRAGQWVGGRPGSGALGKGARIARSGWRNARALDKAVLEAAEARKATKQAELQSAARQFAHETPIEAFGGAAYAGVMAKTQKEQVDNARARIDAQIPRDGIAQLKEALVEALQSGDDATIRAVTDRMATAEGNKGIDAMRSVINTQANTPGVSQGSRESLRKAIGANGGDFAKKAIDVVAWNGQGTTSFAGLDLKDVDVVTQTPETITAARSAGAISDDQVIRITDPNNQTNQQLTEAQRTALR